MVTRKKIIGIVGMPASGKTIVAEHLAKKKGVTRIHLGDFIWAFLKKRGIKLSEEAGVMASLYMWVEYGDIPLVNWARKRIKARKEKIVILDSLRTVEEARIFKDKYKDNFKIISVFAGTEARWKREKKRARFGDLSKLEFRIRDREELRMGVGDLMANADYMIDGSGARIAQTTKAADLVYRKIVK